MKKRWVLFLVLLGLFIPGEAAEIWSEKTVTTITEGVAHTKDVRFTEKGWQRVNVLEIDTENENIALCTMFDSRGIQYLQTVKNMATENGAVAAVNGDFFNWEGTPLGFTAKDGTVISSPAHDTGLATLLETEDGKWMTAYLDMQLFVTCPEGYTAEILHINKYHSMQSMVLYTDAWGGKTPGSQNGVSELVAVDGIVQEVRQNQEGVEVPSGGYVLAISTETSTYLVDNFKEGDPITLSYTLVPDIEDIQTAIGGGTVLVAEGEKAAFTNEISGKHPRTAAGIRADGKTLLLVTVDGRQAATPGMTQDELAEYMLSLGAEYAINLDGGGSTTMVTREGETGNLHLVNLPSDGAARAVSTALGVKFTGPAGTLKTLEVKFGSTAIEGGMVHLYLGAYDEYHNPVYIADKEITYSSPDGTFKGNIFYPSHSGTATVYAMCEGVRGEGKIEVLKKAAPYLDKKPADGTSVLILPGTPAEKSFMDILTAAKMAQLAEQEETVYTLGKNAAETAVDVAKFSTFAVENSLFVTIDAKGGIRTRDAAQWRYLMEMCEETEAKNVFFLLSAPLKDFTDTAEAELFESIITEKVHGQGREVFVVSPGKEAETREENGIRFISVSGTADVRAKSVLEDSQKMCGVRFTLLGDAVHFETVPIWER